MLLSCSALAGTRSSGGVVGHAGSSASSILSQEKSGAGDGECHG